MLKRLIIGLMLGMLGACHTDTLSPSDAAALYQKRLAADKNGNPDAVYDLMEPVPGAVPPQTLPLARAQDLTIASAALEAAKEYARNTNSTAFLVWRNGQVEDARYFGGTAPETPLNSLSLAKPLAVVAIGRAIMLGKIRSLDEPVADFIKEWRGTPKEKISIRQLLQMRSGLQPQEFSANPASPLMKRAYLDPNHDKILIQDYPLTDVPGSRYAYSNAAADLVAIIIERATGSRYASFLSNEVLKPLGAMGGAIWIDRPHGLAHSGCCIRLPAETWLRLGILVLQEGVWGGTRLLSRDFVRDMTMPTAQNPYSGMMGIYVAGRYTVRRGFFGPDQKGRDVLHSEPYLAADLVLFDGNADQVVYVVPSAGLVVLRTGSAPPRSPEWDNSRIPDLLLRGIDWHGNPPPPQPR